MVVCYDYINSVAISPFNIVSPVWFVRPGSCVAHAPPSEWTLLDVIAASVE